MVAVGLFGRPGNGLTLRRVSLRFAPVATMIASRRRSGRENVLDGGAAQDEKVDLGRGAEAKGDAADTNAA